MAMDWLQGRAPELQDAIAARAQLGYERYRMYLQPNNGRCAIVDGLQESIDKINYLAQLWVEFSTTNSPYTEEILDMFWDEVEDIFKMCKWLEWKRGQDNG